MGMIIRYEDFLNEALLHQMQRDYYVYCEGNFRGVSPTKGKYAKIIERRRFRDANYNQKCSFKLEFEEPLIDKRSGEEVETRIIEISSSQIRNLKVINGVDYLRIRAGHTLKYEASAMFDLIKRSINFPLAHKLYDISYFDTDGDTITFLPSNRVDQVLKDKEDPYKSRNRQGSKIGRILKRLNDTLTDQQIENYAVAFKAIWKTINEDISERLRVVTGPEINYWYNCVNYSPGGGSLNSSCMRGETAQPRVAFYAKHPEKIALCILVDEKKKLLARALIWRLDEPKGVVFMDRIYYVLPEHEKMLEMYAAKNNIRTKKSGYNDMYYMEVKLPYTVGEPTPYLDTMHYRTDKKVFSNR